MDNISEWVNAGKQFFEQKEYKKAEGCFKQVLEETDKYADVLNMMGVIHHLEGRFSSAMDFFKKALSVNPKYTEAIMNLVILYNDLGEYENAKKLYTNLKKTPKVSKGQKIEPVIRGKLSNMHANIGDIYRSVGAHKLAIDEYTKALSLNPSYVDIRTKLGQSLREDGQLQKAAKELKEALKVRSSYIPARLQLGLTLYTLGKQKEAKKEWKSVLSQDPENDHAKMYLRLAEAIKTLPVKSKAKQK